MKINLGKGDCFQGEYECIEKNGCFHRQFIILNMPVSSWKTDAPF